MFLTHRAATSKDFAQAHEALRPWYAGLPEMPSKAVWAELLGRESVWSLVIEDADAESRPLSLSLFAFVSDRLADRVESAQCPGIGTSLIERFLSRGDEPLSLERVRAAHFGEGLNLLSLHTVGLDVPLGDASTGIVGELRAYLSFQAARGYRIKRCLREVYGPQAMASFLAGGWRLRSDYADYFGSSVPTPSLERPFLLGLNRDEAEPKEAGGAKMAAMFHMYPIRLELRRVHRELLTAALEGLTDLELSQRLSVSPSAVKKRWASIYEHVEGKVPGMPPSTLRTDQTRGLERRRHVLNYLRAHPEEFRPLYD